MSNDAKYRAAIEQLDEIIAQIESDDIDVDELAVDCAQNEEDSLFQRKQANKRGFI